MNVKMFLHYKVNLLCNCDYVMDEHRENSFAPLKLTLLTHIMNVLQLAHYKRQRKRIVLCKIAKAL